MKELKTAILFFDEEKHYLSEVKEKDVNVNFKNITLIPAIRAELREIVNSLQHKQNPEIEDDVKALQNVMLKLEKISVHISLFND